MQYLFSTADCFLDQCQRFSTQVEVHLQDCHTGLQQPSIAYTELLVAVITSSVTPKAVCV